MSNKVPCGGFYLSDTLGVDENGKLGVNGGEPYKSLVTDGDGGVKWEDRLAYDGRKPYVFNQNSGATYVKVSDVLENISFSNNSTYWKIDYEGDIQKNSNAPIYQYNDKLYSIRDLIYIVLDENILLPDAGPDATFPETGIYFSSAALNGSYISGLSFDPDAIEPEIVWDGNMGNLKEIDEKYIPDMSYIVIKSSTSGSTKRFKITVNDSGAITATEYNA